MRTYFNLRERVAIGELLTLAELCFEAAENSERTGNQAARECNRALATIIISRVVSITKREASPLAMGPKDIVEFLEAARGFKIEEDSMAAPEIVTVQFTREEFDTITRNPRIRGGAQVIAAVAQRTNRETLVAQLPPWIYSKVMTVVGIKGTGTWQTQAQAIANAFHRAGYNQ